MTRILFSNLGYAKGIDGSLSQIMKRFYRYLYCPDKVQTDILGTLDSLIATEDPDLCCFVEIRQGGRFINRLDQLHCLLNSTYPIYDIAEKYGEDNPLKHLPLHKGNSNGFMAKENYPFQRHYFNHGSKRLIYEIKIAENITVLFTHFSLSYKVREKQFAHIRDHLKTVSGSHILLADFNIFNGFVELDDFIAETGLVILNEEDKHTFRFHKQNLALDLCLCSPDLAETADLKIIDQPFSDHDALVVDFPNH